MPLLRSPGDAESFWRVALSLAVPPKPSGPPSRLRPVRPRVGLYECWRRELERAAAGGAATDALTGRAVALLTRLSLLVAGLSDGTTTVDTGKPLPWRAVKRRIGLLVWSWPACNRCVCPLQRSSLPSCKKPTAGPPRSSQGPSWASTVCSTSRSTHRSALTPHTCQADVSKRVDGLKRSDVLCVVTCSC